MGHPRILGPVEITSSNKWFDYYISGADKSVSIATGVYATIFAVETALEAAIGADLNPDGSGMSIGSSDGKVYFVFDSSTVIKWATGAHAGSNLATVLGFSAADTSSATTIASTFQHAGGWYARRYPTSDSGDRFESRASELRTTLDATASKRMKYGERYTRELYFDLLPAYKVFTASATSTDTNNDIEQVLDWCSKGYIVRYYPDSAESSYSNYYIESPMKMSDIGERPHLDLDYYSLRLIMVRKET